MGKRDSVDPTGVRVGQRWVSKTDPKLIITIMGLVDRDDTWAVASSIGVPFQITAKDLLAGYRLA